MEKIPCFWEDGKNGLISYSVCVCAMEHLQFKCKFIMKFDLAREIGGVRKKYAHKLKINILWFLASFNIKCFSWSDAIIFAIAAAGDGAAVAATAFKLSFMNIHMENSFCWQFYQTSVTGLELITRQQ